MSSPDITPSDAELRSARAGAEAAVRRHTILGITAVVAAVGEVLFCLMGTWPTLFSTGVITQPPTLGNAIRSGIFAAGCLSLAVCLAIIFWYDRALAAAILLCLENLTKAWYCAREVVFSYPALRLWAREHPLQAALQGLFPLIAPIAVFSLVAFLLAVCFAPPNPLGDRRGRTALRVSALAVIIIGVVTLTEYFYAVAMNFQLVPQFLFASALRLASLGTLVSFFVALHHANRHEQILDRSL